LKAWFIFLSNNEHQRPLVEFKAGKMVKEGSTVKADNRKGKIALLISPEDQLLHFQWKDRADKVIEVGIFNVQWRLTIIDRISFSSQVMLPSPGFKRLPMAEFTY